MNEQILAIAVSNLALSALLALVALVVHTRTKRPWLAHLFWLLVLAKLVTPSLISAPLITISPSTAARTAPAYQLPSDATDLTIIPPSEALDATIPVSAAPARAINMAPPVTKFILLIWLIGSATVLCLSLTRIVRFHRHLKSASRSATPWLARMLTSISNQLGLRRTPEMRLVDANIAPLVWWVGGRACIVLPTSMADGLDRSALRLVVAHELAHLSRGDHFVRWFEWFASVLFWWCPLLWIARRGLHQNEELCCDALVVEQLSVTPTTYANSILDAIELLAAPAIRPPAIASQMTSGGTLEERLTMIISNPTILAPSRWSRFAALLMAAVVLPFGIAHAQNPNYEAVGARLMNAVDSGELSASQAKAMFGALAAQHFEESLEARHTDVVQEQHNRDTQDLRRNYKELSGQVRGGAKQGEASEGSAGHPLIELSRQLSAQVQEVDATISLPRRGNAARRTEALLNADQTLRRDARLPEAIRREVTAPLTLERMNGTTEQAATNAYVERAIEYQRALKRAQPREYAEQLSDATEHYKELDNAIEHTYRESAKLEALIRDGEVDHNLLKLYRDGLLNHELSRVKELGANKEVIQSLRNAIELTETERDHTKARNN